MTRDRISRVAAVLAFGVAPSAPVTIDVPRDVANCQECLGQMGGGGPGHSFQSGGEMYQTDGHGHHLDWRAGYCDAEHTLCPGEDVEATVVESVEGAARFVSQRLVFHAGRNVFQLLDCQGRGVIAQFPRLPAVGEE